MHFSRNKILESNFQALKKLPFRFDKNSRNEKIKLLYFFINNKTGKINQCRNLNKLLLAMLAYPDNKEVFDLTKQAQSVLLNHIEESKELTSKLKGSGIFNTESIECSFSYEMAKYLIEKFPNQCNIHSSTIDEENLKLIFKFLLPSVEYMRIHDGNLNVISRIALFNKEKVQTNLEWLLTLLDQNFKNEKIKELIYSQMRIILKVKISQSQLSTGLLKGLNHPVYFQKNPFNKNLSLGRISKKKLPKPLKLNKEKKRDLIDVAKITLFHLCSETEPFTNANVEDITFYSLDNGISIALFGSKVSKRYSLESYIGYLVFKNNIPVAYGGGWIFGERCQFGINIMENFRGGESNRIFNELIRVYHQYFGATNFVVKPYQFGLNNPDGLKAGAFWFYYKLGFRPEDNNLKNLALSEIKRKNKNNKYKSDLSVLKKFTKSNLSLNFCENNFPSFDAAEISIRITDFINKKYKGNRENALNDCFNILKKLLPINENKWKEEDILYAKNVSLLFCLKPDSKQWIKKNKNNILRFILLKSAKTERPWIKSLQQFNSFWKRISVK